MGIGVSIFLIAVGGILTFATDVNLAGLDLRVVGVVLMIAGVIGLLLTLVIWGPRRRSVAVSEERPVIRERRGPVVEERRRYDDVYDDGPGL